jgi:hypothetical protein
MPVLIVAIVFSVPLAAIVGAFWVKVKRMEFEAGARDVEPRLRALEAENRELRSRVEVLETIVTSDEPQRLRTRVRVEAAAPAASEAVEVAASAARDVRKVG